MRAFHWFLYVKVFSLITFSPISFDHVIRSIDPNTNKTTHSNCNDQYLMVFCIINLSFHKLLPVFQNGCASLHSHWQFYLFGFLADTFSPFNSIHFGRCVMVSHCSHVFSLISNDVFICWFHVLIGHLDVLFFLFYFWLHF